MPIGLAPKELSELVFIHPCEREIGLGARLYFLLTIHLLHQPGCVHFRVVTHMSDEVALLSCSTATKLGCHEDTHFPSCLE